MTKKGRPSSYTAAIGGAICARLAEGESLASVCRDAAMPCYSAVRLWEAENPAFLALSMRARETGCHKMAEDCLEIADDGINDWMERGDDKGWELNGEHIQRSRLRIETRMRLLGKWLPKVYGDKQHIEHSGEIGIAERLKRAEQRRK
jgi:hypothetical protein